MSKLTPAQEILLLAVKYNDMFMDFPARSRIEENTSLARNRIRMTLDQMERDGLIRPKKYQPPNKRLLEVTEKGFAEVEGLECHDV